jgi:Phage integrase family
VPPPWQHAACVFRPLIAVVLRDATHWDEVVTALGYEHLRRHDLRHTGLTWMADAGVPVHVLRKIAGHGSLTTTQRYLQPEPAVDRRGRDRAERASVGPSVPKWSPTPSRGVGDGEHEQIRERAAELD